MARRSALRSVLLAAGLAWGAACGPGEEAVPAPEPAPPAAERPNVVFLIADDQGYGDYGFMGSEWVETPNLDRLAAEGLVFELAYNTGSYCRPSLNSLLTGLHPFQWSLRLERLRRTVPDLDEDHAIAHVPTLPRLLAEQGYASFQAGKYWEGDYHDGGFTDGVTGRFDPAAPWGGEGAARIGRETLEPVARFLEENGDRPFFLWVAPVLPHIPHDAPDRYRARYEGRGLARSAVAYYASCTWFDDVAGQLLELLDRHGLRERTIVVMLADNGWDQRPHEEHPDVQEAMMGGVRGKHSFHDLGFRTPIVVRWPGRIEPRRVPRALVSTVDLVPTILRYAGAPVPPGLAGTDLSVVFEGDPDVDREYLVGSMERVRLARPPAVNSIAELEARKDELVPFSYFFHLRSRFWHYQRFEVQGREHLYDLRSDPDEEHDVAAQHPERVARYREAIEAWKREMRASVAEMEGS